LEFAFDQQQRRNRSQKKKEESYMEHHVVSWNAWLKALFATTTRHRELELRKDQPLEGGLLA